MSTLPLRMPRQGILQGCQSNIAKREPLSTVGEKIVKPVWKTVWGFFFKKLKMEL